MQKKDKIYLKIKQEFVKDALEFTISKSMLQTI